MLYVFFGLIAISLLILKFSTDKVDENGKKIK